MKMLAWAHRFIMKFKKQKLLWMSILLLAVVFGGAPMVGFTKVMFSEVQGVVVDHGKPVVGAKVVRRFSWAWNDYEKEEQTITDVNGNFHFPTAKKFNILTSIFPHQPHISQYIFINVDGQEYRAWMSFKRDYDQNGELNGKAININCDISTKEGHYINDDIRGICELI